MARKSARKKRQRGYEQSDATGAFHTKVKRPHIAEEYMDMGKPDVAFEMVRGLRERYRRAVIGTAVKPGEAYST